MTRIKICGITRVSDAQLALQLGADALGLVFYRPSPRCIDIQTAHAIARIMPAFTTLVGLFVNASAAEVQAVLTDVRLDVLQFHGDEEAAFCRQFGLPYIKAVRVSQPQDISDAAHIFQDARALLFDAHVDGLYGGTGQAFDWQILPQNLPSAWVLSGGLEPNNIAAAIHKTGAQAVDVSSGVEAAKGIKDAAKMRQFIQGAKSAGTTITQ